MNKGTATGLTVQQLIPPGVIWEYGGLVLPDEETFGVWAWADGTLVSRAQYPALFQTVGFSYSPTPGTDPGGGMFYLPNRKGRMGVGRDTGQTEFDVLGESGGSKTATALHTHGMSSHTHTLATHDHHMNGHVHGGNAHNHGLENHTHYTSTGDISANHVHWNQNGVVAFFSDDIHNHAGGGGQLSESGGAVGGTFFGTNAQTTTGNVGHVHAGESGWFNNAQGRGGAENVGNTGGNSGNVSGAQNVGAAQGPSNNTSEASSVGAASGNLPPYLVMNYIVKC